MTATKTPIKSPRAQGSSLGLLDHTKIRTAKIKHALKDRMNKKLLLHTARNKLVNQEIRGNKHLTDSNEAQGEARTPWLQSWQGQLLRPGLTPGLRPTLCRTGLPRPQGQDVPCIRSSLWFHATLHSTLICKKKEVLGICENEARSEWKTALKRCSILPPEASVQILAKEISRAQRMGQGH